MEAKMKIPKLTRQPIKYVDATPDNNYPLRILEAYRQDCDCRWAEDTDGGKVKNPLLKQMNADCEKRAEILDKAIQKLRA